MATLLDILSILPSKRIMRFRQRNVATTERSENFDFRGKDDHVFKRNLELFYGILFAFVV